MRAMKLALPAAILTIGFLLCTSATYGKPEYSKKEKQACTYCHVKSGAQDLNDTGKCYKDNDHALARCSALEKEVQTLKAELAALRAQIQRGGSTQTPVGSVDRDHGARPSEAEIRACVAAAPTQIGGTYGFISGQIEFGAVITSQGGTLEMGMGAPKGTSIFPIRINEADRGMVWEFWAFKDSFGTLKCYRH